MILGSEDAAEENSTGKDDIVPEDFANGELPSQGSAGHADGTCKPCCFFQRQKCHSGKDCPYCHFKHDKPKRPGKKMREQMRKRLKKEDDAENLSCQDLEGGTETADQESEASESKNHSSS